jgi:CPA1 family monovalent cation:H+ antiporter
LIGLQLPYVMGQITGMGRVVLLDFGVAFSAAMIAVRMAWVFGESYLAFAIQRWVLKVETEKLEPRRLFVIGWSGMRGVLSLAAAVSLPYVLPDGRIFPQRSMIIYLAFCLIVATLVVQGLTLPRLIRWLGLSKSARVKDEKQEARRVLVREALVHLDRKQLQDRDQSALLGDLIAGYRQRLDAMAAKPYGPAQGMVDQVRRSDAILAVLQAERMALIRLRDEGQIDDEVLRTLQRELDLEESGLHTGAIVVH